MLEVNPVQRISASQALRHEFFAKYFGEKLDLLNTSADSFDTGSEESTAFVNMLQF